MNNSEIELLIKQREEIQQSVDFHSKKLNEFPRTINGLVSDETRDLYNYKFHDNEYNKSFKALRDFNSKLTNKKKKEMRNYKRLEGGQKSWRNYQ